MSGDDHDPATPRTNLNNGTIAPVVEEGPAFFSQEDVQAPSPTNQVSVYRHPKYGEEGSRLRTFPPNWHYAVDPKQLSSAGFFYTGVVDEVQCFHCKGGKRDWDDGDDPWIEHARWFPSCGFVRQVKGDEYIRSVQLASEKDEGDPAAQSTETERGHASQVMNEPLGGSGPLPFTNDAVVNSIAPFSESIEYMAPLYEHTLGPQYFTDNVPVPVFAEPLPVPALSGLGLSDMALPKESDNPIYSQDAQYVINMGYTNNAVSMAIEECKKKGIDWNRDVLVNILCEKQDRGELLLTATQQRKSSLDFIKFNPPESVDAITEQNAILKSNLTCRICDDDREADILFLPCRHRLCRECSNDLNICWLCVSPIKEKIKTYMS